MLLYNLAALELVMLSNDSFFMLGDTALLTCVGHGEPNVQITWSKDGQNIMNDSRFAISDKEVTQRGMIFKQSFLVVCSLEVSDAGDYTCTISNGQASIQAIIELTVFGKNNNNMIAS